MKQIAISKLIFVSLCALFVWALPANAQVLDTVSGSFTSTNGDAAHNFRDLESKLDALLPQLYAQGHNPKIASVTVSIVRQGSSFTTTYKAVIEKSTDGKAWMGFTARGSYGNGASAKCPPDPSLQNYQIRANGQIYGCENADGKSLEEKLKASLGAGEVVIVSIYDDTAVTIREFFVHFTKPAQYPPHTTGQQPTTPQQPTPQQPTTPQTPTPQQPQTPPPETPDLNSGYGVSTMAGGGKGTCSDGVDNDCDGRTDWDGGWDCNGEPAPPDPSCISATSEEIADMRTGSAIPLIPCVNKCDLGSVLQLLNNLISFLIKVIFFPIVVVMFLIIGFKYITSQGNTNMHAKLRSMIWHLVIGILIILCAWLIIKTLLVLIGYTDTLYFFE
jgi:hypothetical protein